MQVDEDFNIKFVKLVEEHKCLYDKKVPEYRNKDFQEKSWIKIAEETRESVPHCKERWRNLRACLSRYIKQQNSSDPQHKPYYLTEHMQFVLPFLKSSRQSGTIINSNSSRNNNKNNSKNNKNKNNNNNNFDYDSKSDINIQARNATHPEETNIGYHDGNDDDGDGTRSVGCYEGDTQNFTHFSEAVAAAAATRKIPTTIQTKHEIIPSSMNCTIPEVNIDNEQSTTNCDGLPPPPPEPEVMFMTSASTDSLQSAERKRIKIEHHYADENSDMDFFKSILPDISNMSPLQKRKFKIGILELIDNVFDRYPSTDKKSSSIMHPPGTLSSSATAASMCMTEIPNCYWKKL